MYWTVAHYALLGVYIALRYDSHFWLSWSGWLRPVVLVDMSVLANRLHHGCIGLRGPLALLGVLVLDTALYLTRKRPFGSQTPY